MQSLPCRSSHGVRKHTLSNTDFYIYNKETLHQHLAPGDVFLLQQKNGACDISKDAKMLTLIQNRKKRRESSGHPAGAGIFFYISFFKKMKLAKHPLQ